jgi:hypothetical protein
MRERVAIVVKRKGNWKKKSVVCFGSVKFVRPFSDGIVALAIVYEVRTVVEKKVKSIPQTVLRNRKVLLKFGVHVVLP